MSDSGYRVEKDSLGEVEVPESALWAAQTQRAIDNFRLSGMPMPGPFIHALGLVKWAAAGANGSLGLRCGKNPIAARSERGLVDIVGNAIPYNQGACCIEP